MLLTPDSRLNDIIAGVIAKAQELYPIQIYALVVLSNHFHLLVSAKDTALVSNFMRFFMGNLSVELGHIRDWKGPSWQRRYRAIPIASSESILDRFRYILANGCKEGLVCTPEDWPGLNCVEALTSGKPIEGIWIDRSAMYRELQRNPNKRLHEDDYSTATSFNLSPLPMWSELPEQEQQYKARQVIEELASEYRRPRRARRTMANNLQKALTRNPHTRPDKTANSPAPLCHAHDADSRERYETGYREFVSAYRAARERLCANLDRLGFPTHAQVLGTLVTNTS